MTGTDDARRTDASASETRLTRRRALKAVAAAGGVASGVGAGTGVGSATVGVDGRIAEFEDLSVDSSNRIVDESDDPWVMRGVSIADPKRLDVTAPLRGKTAERVVGMLTNSSRDWYPRVLRVPASPVDVGEHPAGDRGPTYDEGELASPDVVPDDRRKQRPPQPPAFSREEVRAYLEDHYRPIVDLCRLRGVYCIVDYHRKWHEQPPGADRPFGQDNHLPYDSEYTNYWAYNEYYGTDEPASWGHVDASYREETPGDGYVQDLDGVSDLDGTPYAADAWQVNEALLEEVTLFWDVAAELFGDEPHVIFEPYNEPTAPGIWGPVEGCAAFKQKPLWNTFVYEFARPIVDSIREHAPEKLLLMSVPSWCRGTQGLHWETFGDAGIENVAVTWHNYPEQDVSQVDNWLNDAEYESLDAVESATNKVLEDPRFPQPEAVQDPDCWGWERFQSGGLQNAMDHHPVVVSEFGWEDTLDLDHWVWCRCNLSGASTTFEYGKPILDAMESDDRIGWVAANADPMWGPSMFEFPVDRSRIDDGLVDGNWYHEETTIPTECDDRPCEWHLLGNPDSGQYVKEQLADRRDDRVPFELGPGTRPPTPEGPPAVDGDVPRDPDSDGLYEDVNGDGSTNLADAGDLFLHRDADAVQDHVEAYDFSGNEAIDLADVVELFRENTN